MYKGTVVETSLVDKSILNDIEIVKTWKSGNWVLHDIQLSESQALSFGNYLNDGPWYVHFWQPSSDVVLVVFKKTHFTISHSDTSTWKDAVEYGESIGIPREQLDFVVR